MRRAGIPVEKLAAAHVDPVELATTVKYAGELRLADEAEIGTGFTYPSPKIIAVRQSITHRDGTFIAEVVSTTGLMDLGERALVTDAVGMWRSFLPDATLVGLTPRLAEARRP